MGHTPLSLTAQKRNLSQKWEKAYAEAEAAYCSAAAKALTKNSSKPKLSTFTKTFPRIDHNTLHQHLNGGLTKQGSALKWGLLTETQSESLISFILEMAEKGFPLSYKKIKEYALSILHTKVPVPLLGRTGHGDLLHAVDGKTEASGEGLHYTTLREQSM